MLRRFALPAVALLLCLGGAVFLGYELFESPSNQIFGRTITRGPATDREVALTYDDGPNPPYTTEILRLLESERVHATFFVVGRAVRAYPQVVRREVRDGDAIGNHTWDHPHLIVLSPAHVATSIQRTDAAIFAATGVRTRLLRPPFGARDWIVMRVAKKLGYTVVMWSVPLPRDWEYPAPSVIAQRVLKKVSDGSIIVLHDGNRGQICRRNGVNPHVCDRSRDIEATKLIVDALKREGYRFVTIPQLIASGKSPTRRSGRAAE